MKDNIIKYLKENENPYILKVGDMIIEIEYLEVKRTFNDCIINILQQKKKVD